jgi:hypothetical protein
MVRCIESSKLPNDELVGDGRPVDSTIPTEMVHVAAIIDMLEHLPPEPAYSLAITDPSSTVSRSANRFAALAFDDDDDDVNEIQHLDYDSDSDSNSNNPVPPPRAMQLVPPIQETHGPSYRLYYSAAYRARRARLRRTLRKQLLQQERPVLTVIYDPCASDFQIKAAKARDEYKHFLTLCTMVDRFIETKDSVNTSDYCAFQAIIKGDEGKLLSYRQLLQGPDAMEW